MISKILPNTIKYDGSQIAPLWAYSMGIKGEDLIHIIVERFDSPGSMRLAYYMQRLLIVCIRDVLMDHEIRTKRKGDDLFVRDGKLTVSIASAGVSSEKIHCGINITTKGTPDDIKTAALLDIGINDWKAIAKEIAETFLQETEDIEGDIVKTKSL